MPHCIIKRIVSGGQTGVDQGALTAGLKSKIPIGGWCPKGRKAENGRIPEVFPLKETNSEDYEVRTALNVRDSDGTLVLVKGVPMGGTLLTIKIAEQLNKPCFIFNLKDKNVDQLIAWIRKNKISTLNIAGPRESQEPGIYESSLNFVQELLVNPALKNR
jgi:Circularly permutated YpsA SLOG family